MAVYFDQNGNLVDTEINESSNVFMEDPTENFYQPNNLSPTQDFYEPSIFPSTSYGFINAPQSYYPSNNISPTQDFYPPREFVNAPQNFYPPDLTSTKGLPTLNLQSLPVNMGVANEDDEEQVDPLTGEKETEKYEIDKFGYRKKPSGIAKLANYLPFVGEKSLSRAIINMLPKSSPETINMRNFYGSRYGLTPTGQVASGIMQGYNPVSGGFLNMITRGKYGNPTSYGLADAARRRIDRIANRKIAQTDISRARIKELQKFAREDTTNRARFNNPSVYASADKQGFTDSSGGFKSAGTNQNFSNKTGRGRTGY